MIPMLACLVACGGSSPGEPIVSYPDAVVPALAHTNVDVAGGDIFVSGATVTMSEVARAAVPNWPHELEERLRTRLGESGLHVLARSSDAERPLVATVSATVSGTFVFSFTNVKISLTRGDSVVDEKVIELGPGDGRGTAPDRIAVQLSNFVNESPKIIAALTDARGKTTVVAAATTPPTGPSSNAAPAARATTDGAGDFVSASPQLGAFALVIGIDEYRGLPAATGARADAREFAALARKTLGIPESHIRVAIDNDATKSDIQRGLSWLKSSVTPGSRACVYYSGHGSPATRGPAAGTPYLVPYDADPSSIGSSGVALADALTELSRSKAKDTVVMVDACFSGRGGRSVLPPGARALSRVKEVAPSSQIAIFAASGAEEISGPAADGTHGLFTKYVLEGLGGGRADVNGDGVVSLSELSQFVKPRVSRDAQHDHRAQNPGFTLGKGLGDAESFALAWGLATH